MQKRISRKYWGHCKNLYAVGIEPTQLNLGMSKEAQPTRKKGGLPIPTEQDEQFVVVAWLHKKRVPCHHSPNGGYRNPIEGAKFKRLGVSAGFPDLTIPLARKSYHGLYIELKRVSGGKLSEHQLWWRDVLIREGYAWFEAKGASAAIDIIKNYLDLGD